MIRFFRGFTVFLTIALLCALPTRAFAQVTVSAGVDLGFDAGVSVNIGPPPLPYYQQPPCPQQDLIWMPGYWAYGPGGYYWVPGTWVAAAGPGLLYTPGYWSNNGYGYGWNAGYWGTQVGFYGGINYGYGYYGNGYAGGRWYRNHFQYNTAVTNVNRYDIHNVYVNRTVVNNSYNDPAHRISYNGGRGGIQARPNARQMVIAHQRHVPLTQMQREHIQTAATNRNLYASVNKGRPQQVAVVRPYSANQKPAGYAPLRPQDRQAAQTHLATRQQPANVSHAAKSAQVTHEAPAQHAQPANHAYAPPEHAQPAQHAYTQPQHAQPSTQHAPPPHTYAQPQHAQPAPQHAYSQPQAHAQPQQQMHSQPQQQMHSQPQQQQHSQPQPQQQQHSQPQQQHAQQAPHQGGGEPGHGG